MSPLAKFLRALWTSLKWIAGFFYPFSVRETVPMEMYKRSFHWCFILALCLAAPYYFFLQDNVFIAEAAKYVANIMRYTRGHEYQLFHLDEPVKNINGIFLFVAGLLCIGLFQNRIKDIPPDYRNHGIKTSFSMAVYLLCFIPAGAIVIQIDKNLQTDSQITFQNTLLLLILAAIYGFSGFNFTRFIFDFSAFTGWRKTIHSPWRPSLSYDPFDKQYDRREK